MNRQERRARGERGPGIEAYVPTIGEKKIPTVELAYCHPGDVSDAFMSSVIRLRDYELLRTHALVGIRSRRARSGAIAKARNQIATMFVRSQTDYLFFVDADMGFPPTALQQMLAASDPVERPIVGALCFAHRTEGFDEETNAEVFGMIPTLSIWDQREDGEIVGFKTIVDYKRDTLCEVNSTGAACVLIHRSVLERMQAEYGDNWFTQIPHPALVGECFGEDTSFFLRCHAMGIPLHVHTGVRTSHDKGGIFLTEAAWDAQEQLRAMQAVWAEQALAPEAAA